MSQELTVSRKIDLIELALRTFPEAEMPLIHTFTPGLYTRQITMPAGTLVVSKIHKTEHPFVISKGKVSVWTEENGVVHISAPFMGVTKPGTRRILYIHEDCVWTTFHPTILTNPEDIESVIIEPHQIEIEGLNASNAANIIKQLCAGGTQ